MERIRPQGHLPPARQLLCTIRRKVVEAKQRALSPGGGLSDRIVRWIPQPPSLSLSLLSLSVWIDL